MARTKVPLVGYVLRTVPENDENSELQIICTYKTRVQVYLYYNTVGTYSTRVRFFNSACWIARLLLLRSQTVKNE
jgi:hypothetical protein